MVSPTTGVHVVGSADKSSPPSRTGLWIADLHRLEDGGQKTQHRASVTYEGDCARESAGVEPS